MSDDKGPVRIPDDLFEATDEGALRARREKEAVDSIEAKVQAGEMTVREADEELMKLVLEDFDFFSESTRAALQKRADIMLEESPEIVESRRSIAERYGARTGDEEGSS